MKKGVSKVDWFEPSVIKPNTRAGIVEEPEEYIYSSAGFYAGHGCLIELDVEWLHGY